MKNTQALPQGWELQKTGCDSCGVRYDVLFEGRLLSRDLSYEQALDFIAGDGRESLCDLLCPNCGSDNIRHDGYEYLDAGKVWGVGDCDDCGAHWQMEYRLAVMDTITFPKLECRRSGTSN